jgi:monofunctional glycosyltransferase
MVEPMKKILLVLLASAVLYAGYLGFSLASLPSVAPLADRRTNVTIQVRDWKGTYHPFVVGPKNRYWTPSGAIPPEMKWAVILAEDANFYKHEGVDVKAIKNAIKYDLEKKRFARGASTITQQVAKNLFLTREKTLTRKAKEIVLSRRLEQELTKGRIIELYLNVVELGPMVYGVGHGARYYFGKPASEMTPRESAFLAAMLPGPRIAYNPYRNIRKVIRRSDMILGLLRRHGVLSEEEYRQALAETPNIAGLQRKIDETIRKEETFAQHSTANLTAPPPASPAQPGDLPAEKAPQAPEPAPPPPLPPAEKAAEGK